MNKFNKLYESVLKNTENDIITRIKNGDSFYHTTNKKFDKFKIITKSSVDKVPTPQPIFFAISPKIAKSFNVGNVIEVKINKDSKIWNYDDFNNDTAKGFIEFEDYLIKQHNFNDSDAYEFADVVHKGNWDAIESKEFQQYLKKMNYDGVITKENNRFNLGVINPRIINIIK